MRKRTKQGPVSGKITACDRWLSGTTDKQTSKQPNSRTELRRSSKRRDRCKRLAAWNSVDAHGCHAPQICSQLPCLSETSEQLRRDELVTLTPPGGRGAAIPSVHLLLNVMWTHFTSECLEPWFLQLISLIDFSAGWQSHIVCFCFFCTFQ